MSNEQRISRMKSKIDSQLAPSELVIEDESHLHAGHAGSKGGLGHFHVTIRSDKFEGLRLLQQHRLIYDALGDMMQTDIHALSINSSS
ncbi:MAG: BolA family transcriptional regulator [Gammaproteobacteria bacterium]|nr:BolA family transcriptional regulator [Gammaproteobacteria bacterium]